MLRVFFSFRLLMCVQLLCDYWVKNVIDVTAAAMLVPAVFPVYGQLSRAVISVFATAPLNTHDVPIPRPIHVWYRVRLIHLSHPPLTLSLVLSTCGIVCG